MQACVQWGCRITLAKQPHFTLRPFIHVMNTTLLTIKIIWVDSKFKYSPNWLHPTG